MRTQTKFNGSTDPLEGSAERLEAFAEHVEAQIKLHGQDAFTAHEWTQIREILQSSTDLMRKIQVLEARVLVENEIAEEQSVSEQVIVEKLRHGTE